MQEREDAARAWLDAREAERRARAENHPDLERFAALSEAAGAHCSAVFAKASPDGRRS